MQNNLQVILQERDGTPVVMPSKMGIVVDGIDLGAGVVLSPQPEKRVEGSFQWLGNRSVVENNYTAQDYEVTHPASGRKWRLVPVLLEQKQGGGD